MLAIGLFFAHRAGYVGLRAGAPRRNLLLMLGGLAFFMALQGYLQFVAPSAPHVTGHAEPLPQKSVGTALDYGVMIGYFLAILAVGTWFGRNNKSTHDFFFGGQRFSWWFITMSLVATIVGSFSFVKYSRVAYKYGIASSQTYLNDWFWLPLFLFGWLPIIFFSRVISIPEYFERRFGKAARLTVTALLLIYLVGYIGINLFTMGKVLHQLIGWQILSSACVVAAISAVYVTWGGQTSVIVTDLFQGIMLIAAGGLLFFLGINALGGFGNFWSALPPDHRMAFPNFNTDPSYSMVGVFWQDAMANSAVFYFLNQGVMMRFLSARSVNEGKRAIVATALVLMPIAAVVVASGGWVGAAMTSAGLLPKIENPSDAFFQVSAVLCSPGVFGLIMAALTAALMSTVDTLITAVAAIAVNDVWRPYVRPKRPDRYYLKIARNTSIIVTLVGVALVPVFMSFDSIYSAHGAFTAATTPPLVIAVFCAMLWPRYTSAAAVATVVGGFGMVLLSVVFPQMVAPFAHGVPAIELPADAGLLAGAKVYQFTRALFGLVASAVIAVVVTLVTKPRDPASLRGLTHATSAAFAPRAAAELYQPATKIRAEVRADANEAEDAETGDLIVHLTEAARAALGARPGQRVLVSDRRWWFGGLRSLHGTIADDPAPGDGLAIGLGPQMRTRAARRGGPVIVELIG
ncbi:MAG: sodium:solute symporter family protein [Myxococcales bacterium]|nr:sodium:solute symporter family protein [Myxococcales bacterium]